MAFLISPIYIQLDCLFFWPPHSLMCLLIIKLKKVSIRFIWNQNLKCSSLSQWRSNGGILGILSVLVILGESLGVSMLIFMMGGGRYADC